MAPGAVCALGGFLIRGLTAVWGEKLFPQLLEKQAAFSLASSRPLQGLGHPTGVSLRLGRAGGETGGRDAAGWGYPRAEAMGVR